MTGMVSKTVLAMAKERNRKLREENERLRLEVETHRERAKAREKERDEWRDEYDVAIVTKKRAEGALRELLDRMVLVATDDDGSHEVRVGHGFKSRDAALDTMAPYHAALSTTPPEADGNQEKA